MSDSEHFCCYNNLLYLNPREKYNFENIKIVDILKSNADSTISKPTHLRYLKKPPSTAYPLDLSENADEYVYRNVDSPTSVLVFLEHHLMQNEVWNVMPEITTRICAQRSTLINIMTLTFLKFELTLNVTKYKDSLYLSTAKEFAPFVTTLASKLHHKFAQICFADSPSAEPVTNKPVDENVQWWGIFRAQMKHFDIIYSAEVLGVDAEEEINDLSDMEKLNEYNFVLLRLCGNRIPFAKALKTFLQAKLVNTNNLFVAKRNKNGIVNQRMERVNIETNIRNADEIWKNCNRYLFNFLQAVEKKMHQVDCPHTVYQFVHVPAEKRLKLKIFKGKNEFTFLSEGFVQHTLQREI